MLGDLALEDFGFLGSGGVGFVDVSLVSSDFGLLDSLDALEDFSLGVE